MEFFYCIELFDLQKKKEKVKPLNRTNILNKIFYERDKFYLYLIQNFNVKVYLNKVCQ